MVVKATRARVLKTTLNRALENTLDNRIRTGTDPNPMIMIGDRVMSVKVMGRETSTVVLSRPTEAMKTHGKIVKGNRNLEVKGHFLTGTPTLRGEAIPHLLIRALITKSRAINEILTEHQYQAGINLIEVNFLLIKPVIRTNGKGAEKLMTILTLKGNSAVVGPGSIVLELDELRR